jgi:hypothetical protein
MTKTIYLFGILFLIVFISCSNTSVEYDKPFADGKLLVESYIKEGDTAIMVRLEKPQSVYTRSQYDLDTSSRVHEAIVKVFVDGNEYLLNEYPSTSIFWYGYYMRNSTLYFLNKNISEFSNCRISVDYSGKKYEAKAEYPGKVKILSAEAKINNSIKYTYFNLALDIKCTIDYDKTKNNYYRLKAIADYQYQNKFGKAYYSNSYFNLSENTSNTIELYVNGGISNSDMNMDKSKIVLTNVEIYIEKLSEEYYHLREALNAQHIDDDSPFGGEVIEVPSNINNGYGIFTCISRDSICANIIK